MQFIYRKGNLQQLICSTVESEISVPLKLRSSSFFKLTKVEDNTLSVIPMQFSRLRVRRLF
jgi:hypothetical protein